MKYYTDEHLWVDTSDDTCWTIGITKKGEELLAGLSFADVTGNETLTVEGVKAVYDLHIPITGGRVSVTPMPAQWHEDVPLAKVEGFNLMLEDGLMTKNEYEETINEKE